MKKILLVGEQDEVTYSLICELELDFQMLSSKMDIDTTKNKYNTSKPDMILINFELVEKNVVEIMNWAKEINNECPVLVVSGKEKWVRYLDYYRWEVFETLFRPINRDTLIAKCKSMIKDNDECSQDKSKDELVQDNSNKIVEVSNNNKTKTSNIISKKKILVIDDNALLLRSVKKILEDDYQVFIATSGEMGIRMAEEKGPDLILLDYQMPTLDGPQTYKTLRLTNFGKDIPIIFMTSVSEKAKIVEALELKPAGYILKPFETDKLLKTISDVVNDKVSN